MSISIRIGINVTGKTDCVWTCFSVLQCVSLLLRDVSHGLILPPCHIQCALRPAHPVSPDSLYIDWRSELLAQRCYLRRVVCAVRVDLLYASQACRTSRPIAVLEIVIIVGILRIAENGSSAFCHARRREGIRRRNNGRYQRVSVASQSRRITRHEGLGRRRLSRTRKHGC